MKIFSKIVLQFFHNFCWITQPLFFFNLQDIIRVLSKLQVNVYKFFSTFPWNSFKIPINYFQIFFEIFQRISPKISLNFPNIFPKCAQNIFETHWKMYRKFPEIFSQFILNFFFIQNRTEKSKYWSCKKYLNSAIYPKLSKLFRKYRNEKT